MQKRYILMIDDDEDDRWLFTEAMNHIAPAIRCATVSDGKKALDHLMNEANVLPDTILLDLNMPGMDGKKCLTLLKNNERLKHIPVYIYSTSNFYKDIEESIRLGATDFISKPSDYTMLCHLLKQMVLPQVCLT